MYRHVNKYGDLSTRLPRHNANSSYSRQTTCFMYMNWWGIPFISSAFCRQKPDRCKQFNGLFIIINKLNDKQIKKIICMLIFIICARCISMKVDLLRVNHFFMQDEKKMQISIYFPNPLIIQVSNIPNATKSVPDQFFKWMGTSFEPHSTDFK
jgi:hypothetical protein